MNGKINKGDNLKIMKKIQDNYVDSCISDFPYWLEFMGKHWDKGSPYEWTLPRAKELYRIIKPGGYVLIFGHPKTNHRMKCAFEDVGFQIVDEIDWLYMTGFPKNQDIGKLFDKRAGVEREMVGFDPTSKGIRPGSYNLVGDKWEHKGHPITVPTTELAKQWDGWKTSGLKPAKEPITIFQKPLEGTYCDNIEKYGCGGMNIDACRIPTDDKLVRPSIQRFDNEVYGKGLGAGIQVEPEGRFPMNIITLDESIWFSKYANPFPQWTDQELSKKTQTKEKTLTDGTKNTHPTVKPIALIKWLIKLVTPKDGVTIDITAGSGTHGVACEELNKNEGYNLKWCDIEMDEDENGNSLGYIEIAKKRIEDVV